MSMRRFDLSDVQHMLGLPRRPRRPGPSVSEASRDLRDVANAVEVARAGEGAVGSFPGLALESAASRGLVTLMVRREDKEVFDALQAWLQLRTGARPTQWELFGVVLADALEGAASRRGRSAS